MIPTIEKREENILELEEIKRPRQQVVFFASHTLYTEMFYRRRIMGNKDAVGYGKGRRE